MKRCNCKKYNEFIPNLCQLLNNNPDCVVEIFDFCPWCGQKLELSKAEEQPDNHELVHKSPSEKSPK